MEQEQRLNQSHDLASAEEIQQKVNNILALAKTLTGSDDGKIALRDTILVNIYYYLD